MLKIEVKSSSGKAVNVWLVSPVWAAIIQVKKGESVVVNGIVNPFSMLVANTIEDITSGKTLVIGVQGEDQDFTV